MENCLILKRKARRAPKIFRGISAVESGEEFERHRDRLTDSERLLVKSKRLKERIRLNPGCICLSRKFPTVCRSIDLHFYRKNEQWTLSARWGVLKNE
jgi:hypothetical protein